MLQCFHPDVQKLMYTAVPMLSSLSRELELDSPGSTELELDLPGSTELARLTGVNRCVKAARRAHGCRELASGLRPHGLRTCA